MSRRIFERMGAGARTFDGLVAEIDKMLAQKESELMAV